MSALHHEMTINRDFPIEQNSQWKLLENYIDSIEVWVDFE